MNDPFLHLKRVVTKAALTQASDPDQLTKIQFDIIRREVVEHLMGMDKLMTLEEHPETEALIIKLDVAILTMEEFKGALEAAYHRGRNDSDEDKPRIEIASRIELPDDPRHPPWMPKL